MNIKKLFVVLGVALLSAMLVLVAHSASASAAPLAQAATGTVVPETCGICHKDTGAAHQANYDQLYQDGVIKVTELKYAYKADAAKGNSYVVTFKMTMNGKAISGGKVSTLAIYATKFDGKQFVATPGFESAEGRVSLKGKMTFDDKTGVTTSTLTEDKTKTGKDFLAFPDVMKQDGLIVLIGTDQVVGTLPARIQQGKYPFAAMINTGKGVKYSSPANASGCENCHSKPFLKHGYIYAEVGGDPASDFLTCKACHFDTGEGGHLNWQMNAEDPAVAAAYMAGGEKATDAQAKQFAYKTTLMNDVHMSHAMEFPYPQSMSNCATCHAGKLDKVLSNENMTIETCKSCHPVTGVKVEGPDPADATKKVVIYDTTKLALKTIIPAAIHPDVEKIENCATCHTGTDAAGKGVPSFSQIHTGYDKAIYTADGKKFSENVTVSIDKVAFAGNKLTIDFSATAAKDFTAIDVTKITPTVLVGLYGWNTKDFVIGPHERLIDDNADKAVDSKDSRNLEFVVDGKDKNPRFTTVSAAGGKWQVTADLSAWADMIKDGSVKRVEVGVMPAFTDASKTMLALNAPSRTFDLAKNAFDDKFYSPIVKAGNCDTCHDALATTFHTADRGGNVVVCRMCHITKAGGSHLEMQSRSIDSYVHAIHSSQQFDVAAIDFKDPVASATYNTEIEMPFPRHGITDCESCHVKGTYEVPDQSKSLPGILSASAELKNKTRDIAAQPSIIVGPATRACGSCHKAELVNADSAGWFAMVNQHLTQGGYTVPAGDKPVDALMVVIKQMMAMFK